MKRQRIAFIPDTARHTRPGEERVNTQAETSPTSLEADQTSGVEDPRGAINHIVVEVFVREK